MYQYSTEKPKIFTEEGQVMFLAIRDNVNKLLKTSGAVRLDRAISVVTGDSWTMLACVDRMQELNEIREVTTSGVAGQDRVYVAAR